MGVRKERTKKLVLALQNNELSKDEIAGMIGAEEKELDELLALLFDFELIQFENGLYRLNHKTIHEAKLALFGSAGDMCHDLKNGPMEDLVHGREDAASRMPIAVEIAFYDNVSEGNIDRLNAMYQPIAMDGCGILSKDRLQNVKYHMVISTAVISRFCINKGMSMEEAYSISDTYIRKADASTREDEVQRLHYEMALEYAKRMNRLRYGQVCSMIMIKIMDYISNHLHERILIQDIAAHVSRSVPYVSRLFSSEMGMTASDYIMEKKIEAAAETLLLTDYSITEIAVCYAFSSSSHFTKQFKNKMGVSPKDFRRKYISVAWARREHSNAPENK